MFHRSSFITHYLFLLTLALGCGSGERLYEVTGKVLMKGEPLKSGTVMFFPTEGRAAVGQIQQDGTFKLQALPGKHQVTVEATRIEVKGRPITDLTDEQAAQVNPADAKVIWVVPQKYAERTSTTLTAEVDRKANTVELDIQE